MPSSALKYNVSSTTEQKTVGGEEGSQGGEEVPSDELQEGDEQTETLVGSRRDTE